MSTVKVALRIRPRNPKEILDNVSECIVYDPDVNEKQVTLLPNRTFEFDYVFNIDSSQEMVYECVKPLLDKFLEGFNSTIFAYGQTSSGKTYTMGTGLDGNLNTEMQGIVPRSIYNLFDRLREKESDKFKYRVFVTFLELYNEELTDLLHPESLNNYHIREDPWYGIKEEEVDSPEELLRYLQNGSLCRKTDTTQMNENSSRSHAIFTITLKQEKWVEKENEKNNDNNKLENLTTDESNNKNSDIESKDDKDDTDNKTITNNNENKKTEVKGEWVKLSSKFRFVDLAGSERLKRTQAIGGQVKEGIKINQGLFALGKVIRALADQREKHIPYRESKLTRLLKNSLGGNSQTLMLACVSCCEIDFNESLSTLRYAQSARKIKNKAIINTDWGHSAKDIALMKKKLGELQQTVNRLRDELAWYKGSHNNGNNNLRNDDDINKSFFNSSTYDKLQNELSELKNESESQKDELDELHFTISQLQDRIKDLTQQLLKAEAERDSLSIEFFKDKSQENEEMMIDEYITESKDKLNDTELDVKNSEEKENTCNNIQIEHNSIKSNQIKKDDDKVNENKEMDNNRENESMNDVNERGNKKENEKENKNKNGDEDVNKNRNNEDNKNENENENNNENENENKNTIKQNPVVVRYLKTIAELTERCQKVEDKLKYYMAIHNDNTNNKKIIRHRPFYEAAKSATTSNKLQDANNTISDSKVDELISRVKSELEKQIKKANNLTSGKENELEDEPGTQEDELLVESIQDDIKVKEELLKTLIASQEKYNIMKENYEKKLKSLQNSIVHAQLERDEALKRIVNKNDSRDTSSVHINNRYIERINKLKNEVSQLKRKYDEATLSISSAKNQNTNQIKTMKSNIESLKAEKAKMMRKIREERERANSKTLEIKKLKKKEYEASQLAKKLEQSNQLQQILLKRRKDEMKACQRKMKSMMDYLNRSNIPKTISKSPRRKRPRNTLLKQQDRDKDDMLINNINLNDESRLQRKKQMLDHELDQCIISQETQHMIDEMEKKKSRLLDEQKELKNEREKIIKIEIAKSKSYDPDQPQYMDDRLEMIDAELQLIDSRIKEAKKNNTLVDGVNGDENGFSNAINIIKSTSFDNLQKLSEMLLSDIVEMKLKERHQMAQAASNERTIADLRVTLQVMKKTAVSAAIEYERKINEIRHQQAFNRRDQGNKTLTEYEDNYSDVTGGEIDDEEDGVIKGGRAEAVVHAAASSNQNSSEDVDYTNNEGSLDYITTSYTPGLPSEIYQNINNYRNDDSKYENAQGEVEGENEGDYLNDEDIHLPITPYTKKIDDNSIFLKPISTSTSKMNERSFISPSDNTIDDTITINSTNIINTSTPYPISNAKEFDVNTPLKNKVVEEKSPSKKSSFISTLKNSTHFLTAFHNPFTSPKKSPIKKPSFLFLKIGGNNKSEEKNKEVEKETKEKDNNDKNEKEEKEEKKVIKDEKSTTNTTKRKKDDSDDGNNDKLISPPPSKRIKTTEKNKKEQSPDKKGHSSANTNTSPRNNKLSSPKNNRNSPTPIHFEGKIKSKESHEIGSLSDIVKSVHEESMQRLHHEMVNNNKHNSDKHSNTNTNTNSQYSFSQDSETSGDIGRLAYAHTQASQAKINTKSNES
ncbi:kinesin-domain-containing protein [Neocallimastix sp. 'constans']